MNRRRITPWGWAALASAAAGLLSCLQALPPAAQAVLVGALVLVGPGAAVRNWVDMPPSMTLVFVPAFGVAVIVLLTTALVFAEAWDPVVLLLLLSVGVGLSGFFRWIPAGQDLADRRAAQ